MSLDKDDVKSLYALVGVSVLFVALVAIVPHVHIWAINTLFGTQIPHTLLAWAAMLVLNMVVTRPFSGFSKKGK
jgi:hypothetical protein